MTDKEFLLLLERRLTLTSNVLGKKAGEYARGDDRLHNFKRVSEIKRITPAAACIDGFCKHLVSILDMVDDLDRGKRWTRDMWEEKVGDAINYLILLEALVKEDIHESERNNIRGTVRHQSSGGTPGTPLPA